MKQFTYNLLAIYIPTFFSLWLMLYSLHLGVFAFMLFWVVPWMIINIYGLYLLQNNGFIDSVKGDMKFLFWYFVFVGAIPLINLIVIQFFMLNLFFEKVGLFESVKDR